jgi:hypothetical protein
LIVLSELKIINMLKNVTNIRRNLIIEQFLKFICFIIYVDSDCVGV